MYSESVEIQASPI